MNKNELMKNGEFIGEYDYYNNGMHAGTRKFYLLADKLYAVTEWNDQPGHNSESTPLIVSSNLAADLRTCSSIAFCIGNRLPEDAYLDLCGRYGASPDFSYAAWQG